MRVQKCGADSCATTGRAPGASEGGRPGGGGEPAEAVSGGGLPRPAPPSPPPHSPAPPGGCPGGWSGHGLARGRRRGPGAGRGGPEGVQQREVQLAAGRGGVQRRVRGAVEPDGAEERPGGLERAGPGGARGGAVPGLRRAGGSVPRREVLPAPGPGHLGLPQRLRAGGPAARVARPGGGREARELAPRARLALVLRVLRGPRPVPGQVHGGAEPPPAERGAVGRAGGNVRAARVRPAGAGVDRRYDG